MAKLKLPALFSVFSLLIARPVLAAEDIFQRAIFGGFSDTANRAYGGSETAGILQYEYPLLSEVIIIINFLLTLVGVAFLALLVYSGFLWMTARGNEELVNKSKKISREVVTGLLIILTARIVTEAVLYYLGSNAKL